ncbi:GNAT family N-acetyltransferase [Enterococcus wangshanyuanii]|uniref:N-acetyltransferase YycN n=1 Tax=Enterococcus wangshanyuanii TaxID=2005703 RepID=A0ABQ1P8N0_9ENTE|nr:GNAT family N-acetyltransferase [Enterococcus wangshanyuanii]GGC92327.1 putative N-acetyltransferase YycN [Enterococcus wangshanyuanii]
MKLEKMRQETFKDYVALAISEYAKDKIKAGTWSESEALGLAEKSFTDLLPDGPETKDNYLFSLFISESTEEIGIIWIKVTDQKGFIYDFMIDEKYRGQGYGKRALSTIDEWAREHGLQEIGLHVFAHNESAYHLYKKMGYLETDITMVRKIK